MWIELRFPVRCTCGEELRATMKDESRYENNLIEVEPCKRCLDEAFKDGSKKEIIKPLEYTHSPKLIRVALESLRHKINNP